MKHIPVAVLFLFLATGVAVNQGSTESNVGERFVPVLDSFESELSILVEPERGKHCCSTKEVNAVLGKTKTEILQKIPADDIPLRHYTERRLPAPLDESAESAPKRDVDALGTKVKATLNKLTSLQTLRLDLTIQTNPQRAHFELAVSVLSRISTTTNDRLSNVYRGEYEYSVKKEGYKSIRDVINFIDRSGDTLVCELVSDGDPQPALPCQLK